MGLFDKKYCDICGNKIGLLGNKKLSDGNMCKECEEKLSPLFQERKQSTVAEIREQLAYRERNRGAVAAFQITQTYGAGTKLYLDEIGRKFMVSSHSNLREANPDVIDFSQITGCQVDVREYKHEMHRRDAEGKQVSYDPPIYGKGYDFWLNIFVNSPYFQEIRLRLNPSEVKIEPTIRVARDPSTRMHAPAQPVGARPVSVKAEARGGAAAPQHTAQPAGVQPIARPGQTAQPQVRPAQAQPVQPQARPAQGQPSGRPDMNRQAQPVQPVQPQASQAQPVQPQARPVQPQTSPVQPEPQARPVQPQQAAPAPERYVASRVEPYRDAEYMRYLQMSEEIRGYLTGVRDEAIFNGSFQAAQQVQAVNCPYCGAASIPNEDGCCEYCGSVIG